MANEVKTPIPARLYNAAVGGHVAGTEDIYDDTKGKTQKQINTEVEQSLGSGGSVDSRIQSAVNNEKNRAEGVESSQAERITTLENAVGSGGSVDERIATEGAKHYLKSETYSKTEINDHIDTPNQGYITAAADSNTTTANLKTLIDTAAGSDKEKADFIYRVGSWDGSQYDETVYSEYAWNGTDYIFLSKKSQVDEVFDISAYHANTPYADLTAALGANGANVPQALRKGGMSVKFIQGSVGSSDNKYVQYRLMSNTFNTTPSNWQGVDDEPTMESHNLVESGGVYKELSDIHNVLGDKPTQEVITEFTDTGKFLYDTTDGYITAEGYNISDYINIYNCISVRILNAYANENGVRAYCFYDENKNVISYNPDVQSDTYTDVTFNKSDLPNGAYYVRATEDVSATQHSVSITVFNQAKGIVKNVEILNNKTESIELLEIKKSNSENIFINKTVYAHTHIDQTTGNAEVNNNFNATDFISVLPNKEYVVFGSDSVKRNIIILKFDVVFYDKDKHYISYINDGVNNIQTPNNCYYIRFSVLTKEYDASVGWDSFDSWVIQNASEPIVPENDNRIDGAVTKSVLTDKTWMLLGDSITEKNFRTSANYHDFISAETGVNKINLGVSGGGYRLNLDDNLQFLQVLDAYMLAHPTTSPDFITIMGGINDLMFDNAPLGDITDIGNTTLMGCVYMLWNKLQTYFPTTIVGIMSPVPEQGFPNYNENNTIAYKFKVSSSINCSVGDKYEGTMENGFVTDLIISEVNLANGYIIAIQDPEYGQENCPSYSGTLTRTSGSGDTSISYSSIESNILNIFINKLSDFCKHYGIPFLDQYHYSPLRPWDAAQNDKYFRYSESEAHGDGLHPNYYGHKLIYKKIKNFVETFCL